MNDSITFESPGKTIRADLSCESSWLGNTVYPSTVVLRIRYRGYPLIADTSLKLDNDTTLYGLEFAGVEEKHGEMRLGSTFQKIVRLRECGGSKRELSVTLRLSDVSVFLDLNQLGSEQKNRTILPSFIDDAPLVSNSEELPAVAYVGPGALAAEWPKEGSVHLVIFDRPGKLAEMKFALQEDALSPVIERGADGCRLLYTQLPFSKVAPDKAVYSDDIRTSYRGAFDCLLDHYSGNDDDFWVMRGDPKLFVVAARRIADRWIVCGLTGKPRTLTIRLEELWLRLPPEMRPLQWQAAIQRDPVLDEPGDIMEENFNDLAPDARIALDLKKNGGFIIKFEPIKDA